jgi:glucosylceramidase
MISRLIPTMMPSLFTGATVLTAVFGVDVSQAANYTAGPVTVYVTAKDTGQRLADTGELRFTDMPQHTEKQECIFVDPSKEFQTMLGIGGALTDSAAETFYKLPADKQREILTAFFDPQKGIGYTLGRTSINS